MLTGALLLVSRCVFALGGGLESGLLERESCGNVDLAEDDKRCKLVWQAMAANFSVCLTCSTILV